MIINEIIKSFYNLSREHKLIRSFKYDRLSKGAGIGEENYPQVFLEDPIYLGDSTLTDGTITVQVNFDIVMTPQAFENYYGRQLTVEDCQNVAHEIALSFIAKLKYDSTHYDEDEVEEEFYQIRPIKWSFVTLRNWYDNAAAGIRCTLTLGIDNPINICDVEENFDPEKEFNLNDLLSDIDTNGAEGCVTFDYKLPKFTL